ncbi:MAG: hypothetical protein JWO05_11 [Gemmatimonadetes bacterium]|nr:hypothetical protein [Gemmatimonadota bacterium]
MVREWRGRHALPDPDSMRLASVTFAIVFSAAAARASGAQSQAGNAQGTGALAGTVRDTLGRPVEGAVVRVLDEGTTARSDARGAWSMAAVPAARLRLVVRRLGFAPETSSVVVERGTLAHLDVRLSSSVQQLEGVSIEGRAGDVPMKYVDTHRFDLFYSRRARGGGIFLTRDDIDRKEQASVLDLLRLSSNANIMQQGSSVRIAFPRCPAPRDRPPARARNSAGQLLPDAPLSEFENLVLFVDGMRVREAAGRLADLSTTDIEAIEIYRGSTELPIEAARDHACAAVFVWLRYESKDK